MVLLLAAFKDMLQMSAVLMETLLKAPCKIVHHADTLCPWNFPDPSMRKPPPPDNHGLESCNNSKDQRDSRGRVCPHGGQFCNLWTILQFEDNFATSGQFCKVHSEVSPSKLWTFGAYL